LDEDISENDLLRKLCDEVSGARELSDDQFELLSRAFDIRFEKAYKTVKDGRVKKYVFQPSRRVVWIVIGRERDYQVMPLANFCTCDDFYFRVINHRTDLCYHIIAQKLAEALNVYERIEESDGLYEALMKDWRIVKIEKRRLPATEMENVRGAAVVTLLERENATIHQLLEELRTAGFDVLTTRHLAAVLSADKKKRFRCERGRWKLK